MLLQEDIISVLNKLLKQKARIRKGQDAVYFCPNCNHYKRKFEVNLYTGKYNCWVCGFSGLSFKTLFKKLNAPLEYYSLLNLGITSSKDSVNAIDKLFKEDPKAKKVVQFLPKEFKPICIPTKSIEYRNAINYLKRRSITKYDVYRYNIGYCESGDFSRRIIIPSYDKNHNLNFFTGRCYYKDCILKYKNCDFSKDIIGFESDIYWQDTNGITLTEGTFDSIAIRYNAIPLFGKTLSEKLKTTIIENGVVRVNVVLDNDAIRDSINLYDELINMGVKSVHFIVLKDKDPSKLGFEEISSIICDSKQTTMSDILAIKIKYS
jgi:transcription elongation factor Elf1